MLLPIADRPTQQEIRRSQSLPSGDVSSASKSGGPGRVPAKEGAVSINSSPVVSKKPAAVKGKPLGNSAKLIDRLQSRQGNASDPEAAEKLRRRTQMAHLFAVVNTSKFEVERVKALDVER